MLERLQKCYLDGFLELGDYIFAVDSHLKVVNYITDYFYYRVCFFR